MMAVCGYTTDEDTSFLTGNVPWPTIRIPIPAMCSRWPASIPPGQLGLVTDNGDGTFTYDPNGAFESLAVGETATDTFTYTIE